MLKALVHQPLMHMNFRDFDELLGSCRAAFKAWDDAMDGFRSLVRTMTLRKKDGATAASSLPVCAGRTNTWMDTSAHI